MEEEDDTDDKKDEVERQHKAAEESKQEGILNTRVQSETSKDTDNKGAQQQGAEVFQMNSETKVLELQAQNDIKESITEKNDSALDAGESSLNTGVGHTEAAVAVRKSCKKIKGPLDISRINNKGHSSDESKPHHKEAVYQNWPPEPLEELQEAEESALADIRRSVPPVSERLARLAAEGALDSGRTNNTGFSSDKSSQKSKPHAKEHVYQNWPPPGFQQPEESEESEESTSPPIYIPTMAERAAILAAGGTLDSGRPKYEYTGWKRHINNQKSKPCAKEPESEESTLTENLASGSLTTEHQVQLEEKCKKSVTKVESKHCSSPKKQSRQTASGDIRGKQTHASGTKPESSPALSQKQSQLSKGQKSVHTLRQAGKENQQKEKTKKQDLQSTPEGKMQQKKGGSDQTKSDQKLKTEEKQTAQAKEGKKQTVSQKEQRPVTKPVEIRKTEKREQKLPASQNSPSKKSPVHRKEQTTTSPKRNPSPQALPKEKQSNLVKKVRQKGSNANTIKNNESKGTGQQQATENMLVAKNLQNPSVAQSTAAVPSLELQETSGKDMSKESTGSLLKESGKEALKEYKKQEEDQAQETNKLTEKKSQHEKKNEIKKQKQQNEVNQQVKQLKKENLELTEHRNKIPQKSEQSKAPMAQKKVESSALEKQAQQSRNTNAMQQQLKDIDKKSSEKQCLKDVKEVDKSNRNTQNAISNKEKSSKAAIHSIRKQYQKLCKEELMKQQLLEQSLYSPQPAQKEEKVKQQQKPEAKSDENKLGMKENLNQLAKKKMEDYEDDKDLGCGGIQGSSCPIYFGVRSYLHHFYDTTPLKNPQLYEECTEEDDFEYAIDPVKPRGCRKCCQGFWFRAGLWGGINLILVGVITFLVGYLTPQREIVVGQQGDLEILDRSAIIFNHRLELCRLAGLAVFCCGGMVLFVVLFISTLLHVKGHNNNEGTCCTENIYYHGYMAAPLVEPFIVAQDLTMPTTTTIKIPILEEIKSVQPNTWPEMGTVRDGSRVGQMP